MKLATYAESWKMPRKGFGAAVTWMPAAWRSSMTPSQLDESAKAPWTRTTVSGAVEVASDMSGSLLGVDVDDRPGEGLRRLLRQVVADAAGDGPVRVRARELPRVGAGVRMRRAVGVAFEADRRDVDDGGLGQAALQRVVLRLAVAQADPPAVVVDHDRHVIRVVERGGAALERGVVEVPLGRGRPPDEPRELAPVALVPGPAALGREVVLVPPLPLGLRRQRQLAGLLASDQIPAHRDEPGAPLRPERRDDVGRPRSPVGAGDNRLLDPQGVHQGDGVDRHDRLLPVAERLVGEKARRAVAA